MTFCQKISCGTFKIQEVVNHISDTQVIALKELLKVCADIQPQEKKCLQTFSVAKSSFGKTGIAVKV